MKRLTYMISGMLLFLLVWSCNENPIDSEQYEKRIYLVNGMDKVYSPKLKYSDSVQESFVSVAISGSLTQDRDVKVELELAPDAVPVYNEKYIGRWSTKPYYTVMPEKYYSIPSLEAELKAGGETFVRVPVFMNSAEIHCDSTYALPLRIKSVSEYEVNAQISTLLVAFDMINDYSAMYQMSGQKIDVAAGTMVNIGKSKTLKAVSERAVRMFIESSKDDDRTLVPSMTLKVTVAADNTVSVVAWDAAKAAFTITSSGGTYHPSGRIFHLWYDYAEKTGGKQYKVMEVLENR